MRPTNDPFSLTPDERRFELANVFAAGILRLHARLAIRGDDATPQISSDSETACLEVPDETVLSVIHGG